jgi:hypothetical protein
MAQLLRQDYVKIVKRFEQAILFMQGLEDESYLKPGEQYLIIDRKPGGKSVFSEAMEDAARSVGLKPTVYALDSPEAYEFFPKALYDMFLTERPRAGATLFDYTGAEELHGAELGARIELLMQYIRKNEFSDLHSPGITVDMVLEGALQCDFRELAQMAKRMMKLTEYAERLYITAPGGTDLEVVIPENIPWETDCTVVPPDAKGNKGKFGNLPPGENWLEDDEDIEVYNREAGKTVVKSYPVKITANGVLVCDVCTGSTGPIGNKPLVVEFKDGRVVGYRCDDNKHSQVFTQWEETAQRYGKDTILQEVGAGFNPKARVTGNMLESEKVDETMHLAPANIDNHEDLLFRGQNVTAEYKDGSKKQIMVNGKVVF